MITVRKIVVPLREVPDGEIIIRMKGTRPCRVFRRFQDLPLSANTGGHLVGCYKEPVYLLYLHNEQYTIVSNRREVIWVMTDTKLRNYLDNKPLSALPEPSHARARSVIGRLVQRMIR